jgi:Na+/proline symporter
MNKDKKNKQFGYLFFFVLSFISIFIFFNSNKINYILISLSLIFLIITIFRPILFDGISNIWIKFGELLGKFISPLVMILIFFLFLTPLSFIVRMMGKDLLKTKFSKQKSYWIKREKNIGTMNKQY